MPDFQQQVAEARAMHQEGEISKAERAYRQLLQEAPDEPLLVHGLGMIALQSGYMQQAEELLSRATELAPDIAETWTGLAQHEEVHGRWKSAIEHYDRALTISAHLVTVHRRRAFALEMDGQLELASRAYRDANRLSSEQLENVAQSPWRNIYHCCTQKTASQWIRALFGHPAFFRATGLYPQPFVQLGLNEAKPMRPWPANTAVCHLYVHYQDFSAMPKPGRHRSFFVLRDPRDAVVSWYHSARYSHNAAYPIPYLRQQLAGRSPLHGLTFMTTWLQKVGYFDAQLSWLDACQNGADTAVFRYEDLCGDSRAFIEQLLDYLHIPMSSADRDLLDTDLDYQRFSGGREKTDLNIHSHYRKAEPGDWQRYLNGAAWTHFKNTVGDLPARLGYP
ncbi:MAG: sulfotransferase domain-containing protein [Pseudomonadota bacterium]